MAGFTGTKTQEDIKKNEENKKKKIEEKKNATSNKDIYSESTYEEARAKYGQGVGNNKYFMPKEAWEKGKAEQPKQETPKQEQSLVANQFGDRKGKTWNDVLTENENDPEKIMNWLNNNPDYKAGELTKKGMSEFGYKQGEDGKWGKDDSVTNDKVLDGLDEVVVGNAAAKALVDNVTNPETGDIDTEKAKGAVSEYEKKLVETGAASYDENGNFVLKNVNAKGWEDWATVLSAGLSVLGLAFGVPIMPINFRKITNKDEREAKIRELQQQYMDIKAENAGKVEDVKSSAEAGKLAKDNKENIDAYSEYVENVGAYKAKSDIDTDSQMQLIDKQSDARLKELQQELLNNQKILELENKYAQQMARLSSDLSTASAKELTSYSKTGWLVDYVNEMKAQGYENRDMALAIAALGGETPTQMGLKNAESVVGMVTKSIDSASKFVPWNGGKEKD